MNAANALAPARVAPRCFAVLAAVLLLGLTACQSSRGAGEQGHATVTVAGRPVEDVRLIAKQVFNEQGYALHLSTPGEMSFQRHGSGGDALLYGGWGGSGVMQRVRVRFLTVSEKDVRLVATVYSVRNAGDRVMEEESRKLVLSRGEYQDLLAEIQRRAQAP
jgi:hypothetical protein